MRFGPKHEARVAEARGSGDGIRGWFSRPAVVCLALAILALWAYWPVDRFDFVEFDDCDYVRENPQVLGGLTADNVVWAFGNHACNWHPLTWISHMLDVELFGPAAGGPHLVNLLFHVANALLLFAFLRRATGALWRSALVAGLFALHPLHVESVAWISERKDVLSAFFGLLTLLAYSQYVAIRGERPKPASEGPAQGPPAGEGGGTVARGKSTTRYYLAALLFFALGLMSKPMLVSLPLILLLLDYWPWRRLELKAGRFPWPEIAALVREKIPFFALAALSCVATLIAQNQGAVQSLARFSVGMRLENAVVAYARYLGKTLWPAKLSLLYPHPGHWPVMAVVLATLLLAFLWFAAARWGRKWRFLLTGWAWFFVMLIPVIGLVQVGEQSLADRYTYLPLIGVFAALAWGAGEWAARRPQLKIGIVLVAGLVLAACAWRTRVQVACWQNTESLYQNALAVTQRNPLVLQFLGYHYYNLGNQAKDAGRLEEALGRYRKALEMDPNNAMTHNNLGMVFQMGGRLDAAVPEYEQAVRLAPDNANAHNNFGVALAGLGKLDEAIAQFTQSVRLAPDNAGVHNNLGALLARQGRYREAIPEYTEAVRLAPGNPAVHDNLGDALAHEGRTNEAIVLYRQALRLNPADPTALKRLRALGVSPVE